MERKEKEMKERRKGWGQTGAWGEDRAKSVVARDEVNYIMHMTGGRQYKKQSASDGGMPPC